MSNIFPSLRAVMGNWVYYPIVMSATEISERIMRSKDIRENKTLDDYLQREITPNVKKITEYIENNEDRFFNSIIVGVFDDTPNWYPLDLKHVDIVSDERREYLEECMGLLELKGSEKLFAIDGQHRVEAIKKQILNNFHFKDQFSIILVQHVDSISGKKRTRKLFSDINKKAQKVSPGELAIIDEEDIENIAARMIYGDFERLPYTSILLSRTTTVNDPKFFMSLLTLVGIGKVFKRNLKIQNSEELFEVEKNFLNFLFDCFPEIEISFNSVDVAVDLRENKKMIFMRHIGLVVLAEIYSISYLKGDVKNLKLKLLSIDLKFTSILFADNIYSGNEVVAKHKLGAIKKLKAVLEYS